MIKFTKIDVGIYRCLINLTDLYSETELEKFNKRWEDFFSSDTANAEVFEREGNTITYLHKSWIPSKTDSRIPVLLLFGNPAPHSVRDDIYFSYEGSGGEHRFWKVFRELGYISIDPNPTTIKSNFFNLNYDSPFRLGFDVIYTFPSTPCKPKWSGVAGIERLFGKKVKSQIFEAEKQRIKEVVAEFIEEKGSLVALQKDAYNSVASDTYSVKEAVDFELKSPFNNLITIYGTPPTRWLYTNKMKELLKRIKKDILETN